MSYTSCIADEYGSVLNLEQPSCRPHFNIIFTSSYGLGREQLEELNFIVKTMNPVPYTHKVGNALKPRTYDTDIRAFRTQNRICHIRLRCVPI